MARMRTAAPARKVTAATMAAALATVLVWALNTFALPEAQHITETVAGAITTLLVGLVGYFTPPSPNDQIV
jgi:hypothetical protein